MKVRDMELIVRVAETGSMTQAAQQMHLTAAAVSAAVQRVERDIGVRLFERTTRALRATDEGRVVIEGCRDVVDGWSRTLERARSQRKDVEGTVHLSAPADTTYAHLAEVVGSVCAAHPGLSVVFDTSDTVRRLPSDAIDMAIRYGTLPDSGLTATRLAEAPGILVASPAYLEAHGMPDTPPALEQHRCITLHLDNVPTQVWRLESDAEVHEVSVESPLCGDGFLARRLALAGRGIAFKSLLDVIEDLEAGRLVRVLPSWSASSIAVHAVFPSHRYLPLRVRVLERAIRAHFASLVARCEAWNAADAGA